jgi:hypothetical protein
MLHSVFKDLYDQGILIFLDTSNYITNNNNIDLDIFKDRRKFLKMYDDQVELGWIFSYVQDFDEVLNILKEDTCCTIEFGFNSDSEKKALEVGRMLVESLKKFKFITNWDEKALKTHKVSTIIMINDLPESSQKMIEEIF